MTTVFDVSMKVMQFVADVLHGSATAGNTTSLTDTIYLLQEDNYWKGGTLWFKSGANSGKVRPIATHASSVLGWTTSLTAIVAGVRYGVARGAYPWWQIVSSIQQALDETHVTGDDDTLIGDGETLVFDLNGIRSVKRVEFERTGTVQRVMSTHWKETNGELHFDYGYAPYDGDVIHVLYRDAHPELVDETTEISAEINPEWLKWKSAEKLLLWGAAQYGKDPVYLIEEKMNIVLTNLRGKTARGDGPDVEIRTGGA